MDKSQFGVGSHFLCERPKSKRPLSRSTYNPLTISPCPTPSFHHSHRTWHRDRPFPRLFTRAARHTSIRDAIGFSLAKGTARPISTTPISFHNSKTRDASGSISPFPATSQKKSMSNTGCSKQKKSIWNWIEQGCLHLCLRRCGKDGERRRYRSTAGDSRRGASARRRRSSLPQIAPYAKAISLRRLLDLQQ